MESELRLFKTPAVRKHVQRWATYWSKIPLGPPDPTIGLLDSVRKDTHPDKVDLTMGTYRNEKGEPHVMRSVLQASENILSNMSKEYLPIQGHPTYCRMCEELTFGKDNPDSKDKLVSAQCVAGTGALSIGGIFLHRFWPGKKIIYVSKPTWPPHISIFRSTGLQIGEYKYTDPKTIKLTFKNVMDDVNSMPDESIILLHACVHNPTGADLSEEQWKQLASILKQKKILPFFDMAFQGMATGNFDTDAFAPRYFLKQGIHFCIATCFSKNMGLYSERIGTLTFTTDGKEDSERIMSQLKIIIRPLYNSPPVNGALIVVEILSNKELYDMWLSDLEEMLQRLRDMRHELFCALKKQGSKRNWDNVVSQVGPNYYMNMCDEHVARLRKEFHIYVRQKGRLSIAGLNRCNVDYVAKGLHEVTK